LLTPSNGAQNNFLQVDNVVVDATATGIPEPSTSFILAIGLATLVVMRYYPVWSKKEPAANFRAPRVALIQPASSMPRMS
jgi:hypothetical protein